MKYMSNLYHILRGIIINKIGEQTIVVVSGRLDSPNSNKFEDSIQTILHDMKPDECIDCSEMQYISSSGLRRLLPQLKHIKSVNGKLEVKNLCPEVRTVFDLTGVSVSFNL